MDVDENWMRSTPRYIVDNKKRRIVTDKLFERILSETGNSLGQIQWAANSIELFSPCPLDVRILSHTPTP